MKYSPISPLTWPGGKFRALPEIIPRIPEFREYREPFIGAGHVFFELQRSSIGKIFWINDLNPDLTSFYIWSKSFGKRLTQDIYNLKVEYTNGKDLIEYVVGLPDSGYNKSLRFFVLNRITVNGIGVSRLNTKSKSYSEAKFSRKFTFSLISRVSELELQLKGVKITNLDYSELTRAPGKDVFIFLDPPYLLDRAGDLYGERGSLHRGFDYQRLSNSLQQCEHKWLMTLNDKPVLRDLFSWANVEEYYQDYCMGTGGLHPTKELFISNFKPRFIAPQLETFAEAL